MHILSLPVELLLYIGGKLSLVELLSLYEAFTKTRYESYVLSLTKGLADKILLSLLISSPPTFSLTIIPAGQVNPRSRGFHDQHWLSGQRLYSKPGHFRITSGELKDVRHYHLRRTYSSRSDDAVDMELRATLPCPREVFDSDQNVQGPIEISRFEISFDACNGEPSLSLKFTSDPSESGRLNVSSVGGSLVGLSLHQGKTKVDLLSSWCPDILAIMNVTATVARGGSAYYMHGLGLMIYGLEKSPLMGPWAKVGS